MPQASQKSENLVIRIPNPDQAKDPNFGSKTDPNLSLLNSNSVDQDVSL